MDWKQFLDQKERLMVTSLSSKAGAFDVQTHTKNGVITVQPGVDETGKIGYMLLKGGRKVGNAARWQVETALENGDWTLV